MPQPYPDVNAEHVKCLTRGNGHIHLGVNCVCLQVQQLQGVYNLQEPHFWTLCTDVYIGTVKLLIAPDADSKWILSQTHNIFTQVGEEPILL